MLDVELEEGVRARGELVGTGGGHCAVEVALLNELSQLLDSCDLESTQVFHKHAPFRVFLDAESVPLFSSCSELGGGASPLDVKCELVLHHGRGIQALAARRALSVRVGLR